MADNTPLLSLPFIMPSQAQKHVTHNEALLALDALVHLTVFGESATPPASPAAGSCYVVATGATAEWTGRAGQVAAWQDAAWSFFRPKTGWRAWFADQARLKVFSGGSWIEIPLPSQASFSELGVGATPDATNRLAVSAAATLFNHAGQGHQIKVNKAAASDTASLLFQTNWTGHAEMGLAGDNSFSVKVSDGASWKTALLISSAGHVSRPQQPVARAFRSGSTFTPTAGQQSGFTTFGLNQGGFALGATLAGGGSTIVVPATGLYLVALQVSALSSSTHATSVMLNGAQPVLKCAGSGTWSYSSSSVLSLSANDHLALAHAGSGTLELGPGSTEISIMLL